MPKSPAKNHTAEHSLHEIFRPFLELSPSELKMHKNHTTSTSTRIPQYYDMHLKPSLRLKTIVHVDDMHTRLVSICDEALSNALTMSSTAHKRAVERVEDLCYEFAKSKPLVERQMKREEDVVRHHQVHRAGLLCQAASGILFPEYFDHHEPAHTPFLWTGHSGQKRAIADGFLYTDLDTIAQASYLTPYWKKIFNLIIRSGFKRLAVWEFKSLTAGPHAIDDIKYLPRRFPWVSCTHRSANSPVASHCTSSHESHRCRGQLDITGEDSSTVSRRFHASSSIADRLTSNGASIQPVHGPRYESTIHVVQQGWAESIINNTTFIIFSYGNVEYIGIRDRRRQILFLSPPLDFVDKETWKCYIKISLGMIIAAFQDVVQRAIQMYQHQNYHPSLLRRLATRPRRRIEAPKRIEKQIFNVNLQQSSKYLHKILSKLRQTPFISLRLHGKNIGIQCPTGDTWCFNRVRHQGSDSLARLQTMQVDQSLIQNNNIFLDLEIAQISERVFPVYLGKQPQEDVPSAYYTRCLVMKVAKTPTEIEALHREYTVYSRHKSKTNGIHPFVEQYGLFTSTEAGMTCSILVMEHGGQPLSSRMGHKNYNHHLHIHSKRYNESVAALHKSGLAHRNISGAHILLNLKKQKKRKPRARLISLSGCKIPKANDRTAAYAQDDACLINALLEKT